MNKMLVFMIVIDDVINDWNFWLVYNIIVLIIFIKVYFGVIVCGFFVFV